MIDDPKKEEILNELYSKALELLYENLKSKDCDEDYIEFKINLGIGLISSSIHSSVNESNYNCAIVEIAKAIYDCIKKHQEIDKKEKSCS